MRNLKSNIKNLGVFSYEIYILAMFFLASISPICKYFDLFSISDYSYIVLPSLYSRNLFIFAKGFFSRLVA